MKITKDKYKGMMKNAHRCWMLLWFNQFCATYRFLDFLAVHPQMKHHVPISNKNSNNTNMFPKLLLYCPNRFSMSRQYKIKHFCKIKKYKNLYFLCLIEIILFYYLIEVIQEKSIIFLMLFMFESYMPKNVI